MQGWIYGKFVDIEGNTGQVNSDNVRVRIEPNTGSSATVVANLNQGETFDVVDAENDWYRIVISSESEGWVQNL